MGDSVTRRQARADALSGRVRIGERAVPVALLDIHDPVWRDDDDTADWFIEHGLENPNRKVETLWVSRFQSALYAWANANELMNKTFPNTLDVKLLRGLGIQTAGFARLRAQVGRFN